MIFVSPGKHARHIGIMFPTSSALSHFCFLINNFLKICIYHIQSLQKSNALLKLMQVMFEFEILTELWPFVDFRFDLIMVSDQNL